MGAFISENFHVLLLFLLLFVYNYFGEMKGVCVKSMVSVTSQWESIWSKFVAIIFALDSFSLVYEITLLVS